MWCACVWFHYCALLSLAGTFVPDAVVPARCISRLPHRGPVPRKQDVVASSVFAKGTSVTGTVARFAGGPTSGPSRPSLSRIHSDSYSRVLSFTSELYKTTQTHTHTHDRQLQLPEDSFVGQGSYVPGMASSPPLAGAISVSSFALPPGN